MIQMLMWQFVDKKIIRDVLNIAEPLDYSSFRLICECIKSGNTDLIINLIKNRPNTYYYCFRFIDQNKDIINYFFLKKAIYYPYINWSLALNFSNKDYIRNEIKNNVLVLQHIGNELIKEFILKYKLLEIDLK